MTKPAIRVVNIPPDDLLRANVEHVVRVFGTISEVPGRAKALQGLVFLGFPSVDDDPRPNWAIPEVRRFIERLDAEMPYFPYFLTGEVPFGCLRVYMYCLVDVSVNGAVQPRGLEVLVRRLELDV